MKTEEKILAKALELFNERGVEYVGMRELAAILNMRVSNITYYFPTKDDLVYQLAVDLGVLNAQVFVHNPAITLEGFLHMLKAVYENQLRYKCLFLSVVHLMKQNKKIATRYQQTQTERFATLRLNLQTLVQSGELLLQDEKELEILLSTLSLVNRFWISEAQISYLHLAAAQQIHHYLLIISQLLLPYASQQGAAKLNLLLKNAEIEIF
ncbi:TetR/AcrR family transcriptional regulator [Rhodocytophaga aerolata]|uniref:TetR/AcrR family transcriptional regulator n=1 Tax=Rhodocytophaga aerolata TaxID=455078 RepID=A0ABT8RB10_9BACT|nr:TetR/AcrR family transcriptional regulator [Rhodocytophaga aerolata]MDO1449297.1 TetR/AcrR family transcriptional regulator [Rhodocytophaga aerolata]